MEQHYASIIVALVVAFLLHLVMTWVKRPETTEKRVEEDRSRQQDINTQHANKMLEISHALDIANHTAKNVSTAVSVLNDRVSRQEEQGAKHSESLVVLQMMLNQLIGVSFDGSAHPKMKGKFTQKKSIEQTVEDDL